MKGCLEDVCLEVESQTKGSMSLILSSIVFVRIPRLTHNVRKRGTILTPSEVK